jgi:hypothetical protein
VVERITSSEPLAAAPTAKQVDVVGHDTPYRLPVGVVDGVRSPAVDWLVQVAPPLVVARIIPPSLAKDALPMAKQLELLGHDTPLKSVLGSGAVPAVWFAQLDPPVVVARIPLACPTAKHTELLVHEAPLSRPFFWTSQLDPPLVVVAVTMGSMPSQGLALTTQLEVVAQDALSKSNPLPVD